MFRLSSHDAVFIIQPRGIKFFPSSLCLYGWRNWGLIFSDALPQIYSENFWLFSHVSWCRCLFIFFTVLYYMLYLLQLLQDISLSYFLLFFFLSRYLQPPLLSVALCIFFFFSVIQISLAHKQKSQKTSFQLSS